MCVFHHVPEHRYLMQENYTGQDLEYFEIILWNNVWWTERQSKLNSWQMQAGCLVIKLPPQLTGTVKWTPCMKTEQSKVQEQHTNYGLPYQHRHHYWSHGILQHGCKYLESTALSPLSVTGTLCPDLILPMSTSSTTLDSAGTLPFQGPCNTRKCAPVNNILSVMANGLDWAMVQFDCCSMLL